MSPRRAGGSSSGNGLGGPSAAVGSSIVVTDDDGVARGRYFMVPWVTDPASWRWKMTYMISTGTTVITTAANSDPKSTA